MFFYNFQKLNKMEIEEILEAPQRVKSRSRSPFSDEDSQEEKF